MDTNTIQVIVTESNRCLIVNVVMASAAVGALLVSLWVAFCNRKQFKATAHLNALPLLIDQEERAAQRLEQNGELFDYQCRNRNTDYWNVPTEIRAIKKNLKVLKELHETNQKILNSRADKTKDLTPDEVVALKKVRNIHLLIPIMERLLQYRRELRGLYNMQRVQVDLPDETEEED